MVTFITDTLARRVERKPPPPKREPPRPAPRPEPPRATTPPKPPTTVPYNPAGYVPGGSSPQVGMAIEQQALTYPGPAPVQVPAVVVTNLQQDINRLGPPAPTTPPPPGTPETHPGYPQTGTLDFDQLVQAWDFNGGDPELAALAANIALCESGGDNDVRIHNTAYPSKPNYSRPRPGDLPEYSVGLWQVNLVAHPGYSEAALQTTDANTRAIIAISDNGKGFAHTNANCYNVVTHGSPAPTSGAGPGLAPGPAEPASITDAWGRLLNALGKKVPEGLASITSNANALWRIFE